MNASSSVRGLVPIHVIALTFIAASPFAPAQQFVPNQFSLGSSSSPCRMVVADFSGTGSIRVPDIAATNLSSPNVSVTLGRGPSASAYGTVSSYSIGTGANSFGITAADLRQLGILDLIVSDNSTTGAIAILVNSGNGTFSGPTTLATTGSGTQAVAAADLDGDGWVDVVAMDASSSSLSVFKNNAPTLSLSSTIALGSFTSPAAMTLGPIANGALPDIATANNGTSNLTIVLNTTTSPTITFGTPTTTALASGSAPYDVRIADFDLDGNHDVVVGHRNASIISVLMGTGGGALSSPATTATTAPVLSVDAGDFDGDGKPDLALAVSNAPVNQADILMNGGGSPPSWVLANSFPIGVPSHLMVADLNLDAIPDVAVLATASVVTLTGYRYAPMAVVSSALIPYSPSLQPIVGDLDHDGALDFVAASASGNLLVALGNGSGGFSTSSVSLASPPSVLALAELTSDRNLDCMVGGSTGILPGNGSGSFGTPFGAPGGSVFVDVNGDSNLDSLSVVSGSPTLFAVQMGNGSGGFATPTTYPLGPSSYSTGTHTMGDVNGDGIPDVVTTGLDSPSMAFAYSVLPGTGSGLFGTATETITAGTAGPFNPKLSDANLDGVLDLVGLANLGSTLDVWVGNGSGAFSSALSLSYPPSTSVGFSFIYDPIAVGDVTSDGLPDIVVGYYVPTLAGNSNQLAIYVNQHAGSPGGTPSFSAPLLFPQTISNTDIIFGVAAIADFDNDGQEDVMFPLSSGATGDIRVVSNVAIGPGTVAYFGTGTPGCFGGNGIAANSQPVVGDSNFGVTVTNAPARSLGLLFVSTQQRPSGTNVLSLGALFHTDPMFWESGTPVNIISDLTGAAFAPLPLPNNPALIGTTHYCNSLFFENAGACTGSPFNLVTSFGGSFVILQG